MCPWPARLEASMPSTTRNSSASTIRAPRVRLWSGARPMLRRRARPKSRRRYPAGALLWSLSSWAGPFCFCARTSGPSVLAWILSLLGRPRHSAWLGRSAAVRVGLRPPRWAALATRLAWAICAMNGPRARLWAKPRCWATTHRAWAALTDWANLITVGQLVL